jgi:hypothetical protein
MLEQKDPVLRAVDVQVRSSTRPAINCFKGMVRDMGEKKGLADVEGTIALVEQYWEGALSRATFERA